MGRKEGWRGGGRGGLQCLQIVKNFMDIEYSKMLQFHCRGARAAARPLPTIYMVMRMMRTSFVLKLIKIKLIFPYLLDHPRSFLRHIS